MGRSSGTCTGTLTSEDQCVPGCRTPPDVPRTSCQANERLIDSNTCVAKEMCTCLKHDGTLAKVSLYNY